MKKRGRPRKFDETKVRRALMGVFWRKGYAATSLDELTLASGVNRPSLYGAFGSKLDIFLMCIDFQAQLLAGLRDHVNEEEGSLQYVLEEYFDQLVEYYYRGSDDTQGLGCPIFSGAISEAPNNKKIQSAVQNILRVVESDIKKIITQNTDSQSEQLIQNAVDTAVSVFLSLGIRVRTGMAKDDVKSAANNSVKTIIAALGQPSQHAGQIG